MQRSATAKSPTPTGTARPPRQPRAGRRADAAPHAAADPGLDADALALHRVLSDLTRMLQFRDRDRICCHDVSVTQCYALEALVGRGELTLNELARELYLDKSTASRVVDALVAKGYAERGPHPQDGRAVRLTPTRAGRKLYETIDAELLGEVRGVVGGFPPAVRQSMAEVLRRLVRAAGPRLAADGGGTCCG
ncbi:MAG TPA: MarR family transcriptional regulator [Thermoanaerobaculia bacterium]|nr:MarR family transcriptional regulator [Thermoanaerobaculia bacterium]HXT51985.1 MarR family transcriptional regulator [Thermoanaerobaculia bacterium]